MSSDNSSRRESQSDWYHNRGRTKANITCSGSGEPPVKITNQGDFVAGSGSGRIKGTLPKGICPNCEDEISVNIRDDAGTENISYTIRKHKDAKAPYKRSILISEETWRNLNLKALKSKNSADGTSDKDSLKNAVDNLADQIITDSF